MSANYGRQVMKLEGAKELEKLFEELPKKVTKKALRQAMVAAAAPIIRSAKSKVSVITGLLKKSISKKVRLYYAEGVAYVIIGANTRTEAVKGKTRSGKYRPARIIHLVEKGHGGAMPASPHPFLKPAFDENASKAAKIAEDKLRTVLEAEAAKLGKL